MTDLEITKACAEAMGIRLEDSHDQQMKPGAWWAYKKTLDPDESGGIYLYDPLNDDTQAMALVKKFEINILWYEVNVGSAFPNTVYMWPKKDLNRAICECVAKMGKK